MAKPKVKKVAKKRPVAESKIEVVAETELLKVKLNEAIECLKHYIKKDQIGDLANPAIELLNKWGISCS
jgi:hypothetical protein